MPDPYDEKNLYAVSKLQRHFPELFENIKPLKSGITEDLVTYLRKKKLHSNWVKRSIVVYLNTNAYLHSLCNCTHRYGLKGIEGSVSEREKEAAREKLKERGIFIAKQPTKEFSFDDRIPDDEKIGFNKKREFTPKYKIKKRF